VAIGGPGTLSVPGPFAFLAVALSGATGAVSVRRSSVFFVQAAEWLEATWLSTAIRESIWAYPIVESIHVLTIAVFLGLTAAMDARLLGAAMRETPVGVVMARLLPWIRSGFAVMVVTGLLLFAGTPVRFVTNVFFQIKLALLVLAGLNVWLFHHRLYPTVHEWGGAARPPRHARLAGAASLVLWTLALATGRLIAYNWFE
jgi:hypothetical protein